MPQTLSQQDFESLLDDFKQEKLTVNGKLSVAEYLQKKGYLPILKNIHFAIPDKTVTMTPLARKDGSLTSVTTVPRRTDILTNLDFSGCEISDCQFDECNLSGSSWSKQAVQDCSFKNTVMDYCNISQVDFVNCVFEKTSFDYSTQDHVSFKICELLSCHFNQLNEFEHITFVDGSIKFVTMLGGRPTEFPITINNTAQFSPKTIELLTQRPLTLLNTDNTKTKPTILGIWNNTVPLMSATLAEKMLVDHGLNPLRMDIMVDVNAAALDQEINSLNQLAHQKIQQLKSETEAKVRIKLSKENIDSSQAQFKQRYDQLFIAEWKKQRVSFPMLMLQIMRENNSAYPEMAALYQYASTLFNKVDGILLTGGQDIDPRFYDQKLDPKTGLPTYAAHPELTDPRRDILELMLVYMQQRASHPKPLCGICRGSQIVAAAYDATFYQELNSPERRQYLVETIERNSISDNASLYSVSKTLAEAAKNEGELNVIFMHHQGYNVKTAHGLQEVASKQTSSGPRITVISEDLHQNITASQAHFEYYVDEEQGTDRGFFPHVSASAAESIMRQFGMRVEAYCNRVAIPNSFFAVKHNFLKPTDSLVTHDVVVIK